MPTSLLVNAMIFPVVMYNVRDHSLRRLNSKELMLEKTLESKLDDKEIKPINPKGNQPWIFIGRTHTEAETTILWPPDAKSWLIGKDPEAGEGDDRGWDGWIASPTQWMWVWVNSRSWWWTGKPGVLQSMGLQRVRHNWVTELNWTTTELQSLCDDMDMRYLE